MQRKALMLLVMIFGIACLAVPVQAKGLSSQAKDFMKKAADGGMMEVMLGQTAKDKADAQEVKDFGSRMVTDHGKANEELQALAKKNNVKLPPSLEKKHQKMVDRLNGLSGKDFDKTYMTEMVKDHIKDVADFKKAKQKVKDPELVGWIDKTLPVLEEHLNLAKQVAVKVGVDVNSIK